MKKGIILIAALAVAGIFSSCKKDYSCECTMDGQKYTYELKDVKKKDAKDACNTAGNVWVLMGGSCAIK